MGNSASRFLAVLVFLLTIVCTASVTLLVVGNTQEEQEQTQGTEVVSGVSAEEIEKTVAQFLKDNPYVIVQAFQAAKQQEADKEREQSEQAIKLRKQEINNDPYTPFTGNPDGDVTIVKFSDYNCGFCKRVVPDIITLLEEDKNIKFVVKDFPILGPRSIENSKAAIAVFKIAPEKWWEFHMAMLKRSPNTNDQLLALAGSVGVDMAQLQEEMKKPEYQKQIDKNLALGSAIGVRGTPAFVINGEFIRGAVGLDVFKDRIAAAREKNKS